MWNIPRICVAAAVVALILSGCAPTPPVSTAAPTPTSTPIFANDEEALAAATKAYAAYVKVSDEIFMAGGADSGRLAAVAVGEQLKTNLKGFAEASAKHYVSTGGTKFDRISLQSFSRSVITGEPIVVLYLCEDISAVDVRELEGKSVVSADRPNRIGYQASFDYSAESPNHLLLSNKEPWPDLAC
jgi:hypothetical protein